MFGTMAKPLHAGLASQAGLRAALLASKGFKSRNDALECNQGFAQTHGSDFFVEKAWEQLAHGYHLLNNLFKFHAAFYSTHATIEAVGELRRARGLTPSQVQDIHVLVGEGCRICDLQNPRTELEAKFSLRAAAAFALLDMPTSELACWARDWNVWLQSAGVDNVDPTHGMKFESSAMAYLAAQQGMGIAIAQSFLVQDALHVGLLTQVFPHQAPSDRSYYLLSSPRHIGDSALETFRQWLLTEVEADKRAYGITDVDDAANGTTPAE